MQPRLASDPADLVDALAAFIRSGDGDFDVLALQAARFQAEHSRPLARLWQRSGLDPGKVDDWRTIPALPCLVYKELAIGIGDAEVVFESSGTSGAPSRHPQAHLDLYRVVIEATWDRALASLPGRPDMLALVPDRTAAPLSSLAFMVDHLLRRRGSEHSTRAWSESGLRLGDLRSWLARSQRQGEPVVILATSLALMQALERLAKTGLRFRLPTGSLVIHTGGRKTQQHELGGALIVNLIREHLGLRAEALAGEYGMTELTSHFYGRSAVSSGPDDGEVFCPPPWTRVRILDPETLHECPAGEVGLICVLDLANLSSSIHILTQDLGVAEGGRFRVLGRAEGADLRGCSLLTEQLQSK